jgi:ribosomal protein S18 acetylase RimI-like enzyme
MIEIRTLNLGDYDAICEVWKASGVHYQATGRESREAFAGQMASGLQTVLGAVDCDNGERLVGVVLLTHDGRKGWINRLGVTPDHQRQGIGKMLVRAAEDLLHEKGLTIVAALVEYDNEASLALFKSEGFQVVNAYYLTKRDHPNA